MQITLINHACVKIAIGDVAVLCDPWIDGPVFNFGWDLLIKTPMDIDAIMAGVTHIWISHEHPDHFSPKFLDEIARQYAGRVPILFQETRDRRVKTFCESRGFTVIELPDRVRRPLGGIEVMCGTSEFYDSWLYLSDGNSRVLNLNDCRERDEGGVPQQPAKIPGARPGAPIGVGLAERLPEHRQQPVHQREVIGCELVNREWCRHPVSIGFHSVT